MNELSIQIFALVLTIFIEYVIILLTLKYNRTPLLLYVTLINLVSFPLAVRLYTFQVLTFYETEFFVFVLESVLFGMLIQEKYSRIVLSILLANSVTASLSFIF